MTSDKNFGEILVPATGELDRTKRAPGHFGGKGGGEKIVVFGELVFRRREKKTPRRFEADISALFLVCCYFGFKEK